METALTTSSILLAVVTFAIFGIFIACYILLSLGYQNATKELNRLNQTQKCTWLSWFMIIPIASIFIQWFATVKNVAKPLKSCQQASHHAKLVKLIYMAFWLHILVIVVALLPQVTASDIAISICFVLTFAIDVMLIVSLKKLTSFLRKI